MPFYFGAPFPVAGGNPDALWDFDFTSLSSGGHSASSFLSTTAIGNPAGLAFSRSTVSTVQIDANTIDGTPGVDDACVGNETNDPTKKGLVLQQRATNLITTPRDISGLNVPGGTPGTGTATHTLNQANGPDGASLTADRVAAATTAGGQYANYFHESGNHDGVYSVWFKDAGSNGSQMVANNGPDDEGVATVISHTTSWVRGSLLRPDALGASDAVFFNSVVARDFHSVGGRTVTGCDVYVDLHQFEIGAFASEAIPIGNDTRADDRLAYNRPGSDLIAANGQLRLYAKWIAKSDTAHLLRCWITSSYQQSNNYGTFLTWGSEDYVLLDTNNKIEVLLTGMSSIPKISTNALSFNHGDLVELFIAFGAGLASVCKYKVNGGSWVDLVLATVSQTPNPGASTVYLMCDPAFQADSHQTCQLPCWLQRLTFYKSTGAPAGI